MRKLIYYVACSADRFIAREDGSLADFTADGEHFADLLETYPETIPGHLRDVFSVASDNKHFDAVLMGRRTYEIGLSAGTTNPYPHLEQYLFSQSLEKSPNDDVQLVSDNAIDRVRQLKRQSGKNIWLCGGCDLATTLFRELDELILKVNPFIIGHGIPLFSKSLPKTNLELLEHRAYRNGFMLVRFRLIH